MATGRWTECLKGLGLARIKGRPGPELRGKLSDTKPGVFIECVDVSGAASARACARERLDSVDHVGLAYCVSVHLSSVPWSCILPLRNGFPFPLLHYLASSSPRKLQMCVSALCSAKPLQGLNRVCVRAVSLRFVSVLALRVRCLLCVCVCVCVLCLCVRCVCASTVTRTTQVFAY